MATLQEQTDLLLEKFGGFIKEVTGLNVYLFGQEFTRPLGQYIALNIMSLTESGTPAVGSDADGFMVYSCNYDVRIALTCFRFNSYIPIMKIKNLILTDSLFYTKYLDSTSIGFLKSSSITRSDINLDNVTYEERSYCIFDFNICVTETLTTTSTVIEQVEITSSTYPTSPLSDPIVDTYTLTNLTL